MLLPNEILINNYLITDQPVINNKIVYTIEVRSKLTNDLIHTIKQGGKLFWDLQLMLIRLVEEKSLNIEQYEHLSERIEDFGTERYLFGTNLK